MIHIDKNTALDLDVKLLVGSSVIIIMTRRDGSSQKICAVFVGEDAVRGTMIYLVCRYPVLKKGVWQGV
ncbi:hypothetical protein DFR42_1011339 [Undibacterium pigrum]|uniref:Uncharacterized protein n=1 Tax=Undibacterium pigrum TaxID=401470 RepID=A0A318JKT6_9BURK|nr:hypothetical protein DFR42_1011339 [Undibacterium pigrum]